MMRNRSATVTSDEVVSIHCGGSLASAAFNTFDWARWEIAELGFAAPLHEDRDDLRLIRRSSANNRAHLLLPVLLIDVADVALLARGISGGDEIAGVGVLDALLLTKASTVEVQDNLDRPLCIELVRHDHHGHVVRRLLGHRHLGAGPAAVVSLEATGYAELEKTLGM